MSLSGFATGEPQHPIDAVGPERLIVRFRPSARRLFWSALVMIAACGAVGWFWDSLPERFSHWMLIAAAGAVTVLLVVIPLLKWAGTSYRITTRRVMTRSGVFARKEHEIAHSAGYAIRMRRGPIQRLFGEGTITLAAARETLVLKNVPDAHLINDVLGEELQRTQMAARRAAYGPGGVYFTPTP